MLQDIVSDVVWLCECVPVDSVCSCMFCVSYREAFAAPDRCAARNCIRIACHRGPFGKRRLPALLNRHSDLRRRRLRRKLAHPRQRRTRPLPGAACRNVPVDQRFSLTRTQTAARTVAATSCCVAVHTPGVSLIRFLVRISHSPLIRFLVRISHSLSGTHLSFGGTVEEQQLT